MARKCRKCGGSGDMFVLIHPASGWATVKFAEIKIYESVGYITTGNTIECSLCHGSGVE
jgi:hypothetical protein